jgi:hypothetical protein
MGTEIDESSIERILGALNFEVVPRRGRMVIQPSVRGSMSSAKSI